MMNVSIITATYNSAVTVKDTVISVKEQCYPHIEHIIVDGVSKDNTLEIVTAANQRCLINQQKDSGIYDAMNRGISLAKGDIVGILNSDDFYADTSVIEKVVQLFNETGCEAVYGDLLYVDAADTTKIIRNWQAGPFKRENFLYGWMPPHPTFFVKREVYEKFGNFNLQLRSAADYELVLRFLYRHQIKASYLPEVLVHMRTGGQSNKSISNRIKANLEDRKAWKLNSLKPRIYTLFLKPLRKISQFFIKS